MMTTNPFASFWMGGFEGADHVNARGQALDMGALSAHVARAGEDHRRAAQAGLGCVRESIGWRQAQPEAGGPIDLQRARALGASARQHGLQVLWTLMHYGVPQGLSLHDDSLIAAFAHFAGQVARTLAPLSHQAPVYTPINEISFLAWAASMPHCLAPPNNTAAMGDETARDTGYAVKRRLARAALAGMAAIRGADPRARFLHVEPLVHVVPRRGDADDGRRAAAVSSWQWQAWDLLSGRAEPALGGAPQWLDRIGVNHYDASQWELDTEARLDWATRDARRRPLAGLLRDAWQRYGRPVVLAETSHVGVGRADWLHDVLAQVRQARAEGVPVEGVCVYPLVDRPDWNDPQRWHRSGVWHVQADSGTRSPDAPTLQALREWQRVLPSPQGAARVLAEQPCVLAFSHLRWGFDRHRARHLLSRACGGPGQPRLVFVEEPHGDGVADRLDVIPQGPHAEVWVPHLPGLTAGFDAACRARLLPLLRARLAGHGGAPVVWLSTPMAWPLARALHPGRVVYDVADELSAFLAAPRDMRALEHDLLLAADTVVAASSALAAPRVALAGARLRVLPNGVDALHFGAAVHAAGWDAEEAAHLLAAAGVPRRRGAEPGPVVFGYAGAIDERLDLGLLAALADRRPGWHFWMVGAVLKIDPASLPRRPNLHWLGPVPYRLLPWLMQHWRAAVLPFVLSPLTRAACPLKALEGLAAGLPVVSTALPLLRALQGCGVGWADGPGGADGVDGADAFARALEAVLAETPDEGRARRSRARRFARSADWRTLASALRRWLTGPPPLHVTAAAWDCISQQALLPDRVPGEPRPRRFAAVPVP